MIDQNLNIEEDYEIKKLDELEQMAMDALDGLWVSKLLITYTNMQLTN